MQDFELFEKEEELLRRLTPEKQEQYLNERNTIEEQLNSWNKEIMEREDELEYLKLEYLFRAPFQVRYELIMRCILAMSGKMPVEVYDALVSEITQLFVDGIRWGYLRGRDSKDGV